MGYDVIGDIHGQADKLEALLRKLGYLHRASGWVPPHDRQAVFLGDLIDRGPDQVKVVNAVRSMIDAGHARSVMGNHEFNAIGYATPRRDAPGEFLRLTVSAFSEGKAEAADRLLAFVDRCLRYGDEDVANAVSVSFVENYGALPGECEGLLARWPPALRAELHR